jgi:hypothetical protein
MSEEQDDDKRPAQFARPLTETDRQRIAETIGCLTSLMLHNAGRIDPEREPEWAEIAKVTAKDVATCLLLFGEGTPGEDITDVAYRLVCRRFGHDDDEIARLRGTRQKGGQA